MSPNHFSRGWTRRRATCFSIIISLLIVCVAAGLIVERKTAARLQTSGSASPINSQQADYGRFGQ